MSYKERLPENLHGIFEKRMREHQRRKMGCGCIFLIIVAAILYFIMK